VCQGIEGKKAGRNPENFTPKTVFLYSSGMDGCIYNKLKIVVLTIIYTHGILFRKKEKTPNTRRFSI
jgi:hypothetical protein